MANGYRPFSGLIGNPFEKQQNRYLEGDESRPYNYFTKFYKMSDEELLAAVEYFNSFHSGQPEPGEPTKRFFTGRVRENMIEDLQRRGYKLGGNKPGDWGINIVAHPTGEVFRQEEGDGTEEEGSTGQTPVSAATPEVISTSAGDVISGLPTFNKTLRELFSNVFATALGHAAAQSGGGDVFSSFLPDFLSQFNIPTEIAGTTPPPTREEILQGGLGEEPPVDAGTTINRNLPPYPKNAPVQNPDGSVSLPGFGEGILGRKHGISLGREEGITPYGMQGAPGSGRTYSSGGGGGMPSMSTIGAAAGVINPYLPLVGIGLDVLGGLFGGEDEPPKQNVTAQTMGGGDPYQPVFNDYASQNSLNNFMNFLQVFGPGGINSEQLGGRGGGIAAMSALPETEDGIPVQEPATVTKDRYDLGGDVYGGLPGGDLPTAVPFEGVGETLTSDMIPGYDDYVTGDPGPPLDQQPVGEPVEETAVPTGEDTIITETTDQFMPGQNPFADFFAQMGLADFGGQQGNFMQNLAQFFSLPGYGGPFTTPTGPLQRGALGSAEEFLRSNPFMDTQNISNTLNEMLTTGGRFDLSPEYKAIEDINRRRLEEERANLAEQYGTLGGRFGSDIGRSQAELTSRFLEQEALQKAQLGRESFEAAQMRRMGALPMGGQLSAQQLANLSQIYGLGEQERQVGNEAINRAMAEFARTQGALLPLLLQFALAGSEGDFFQPEPVIV